MANYLRSSGNGNRSGLASKKDVRLANDAASASRSQFGVGMVGSALTGGVVMSAARSRNAASSGSSVLTSFTPIITEDPPGTFTARLQPGTIGGIMPTNMFDDFSITNTGEYFFIATIVAVGGQVTGITLSVSGTPAAGVIPSAGTPPTSFAFTVGIVSDLIPYSLANNPGLIVDEVFQTTVATPAIGEYPFDIYYTWSLT